jgi:hypothetical protein
MAYTGTKDKQLQWLPGTKDVEHWVYECAAEAAQMVLEGVNEREAVIYATEGLGNNPEEALAIILAYGWCDALLGDANSWECFEDDVADTMREMMEG